MKLKEGASFAILFASLVFLFSFHANYSVVVILLSHLCFWYPVHKNVPKQFCLSWCTAASTKVDGLTDTQDAWSHTISHHVNLRSFSLSEYNWQGASKETLLLSNLSGSQSAFIKLWRFHLIFCGLSAAYYNLLTHQGQHREQG